MISVNYTGHEGAFTNDVALREAKKLLGEVVCQMIQRKDHNGGTEGIIEVEEKELSETDRGAGGFGSTDKGE